MILICLGILCILTVQEPLSEYVRLIASVKNALQQRTDKKNEYLVALTEVEAKQIAHNKLAITGAKEDQTSLKLVSTARTVYSILHLHSVRES